jgi:hypothetical protein
LNAPADIAAEKAAVMAAHERVKDRMALLKKLLDLDNKATPREHQLYEELVSIEQRYGPIALSIVEMALNGKKPEATEKMNAECQPLLKQLIATVGEYANKSVHHRNNGIATTRLRDSEMEVSNRREDRSRNGDGRPLKNLNLTGT